VDHVRLTDRDCRLLAFAAQHRIVLASHLEVLLGASADAVRTRVRALERVGYLNSQAPFDRQPRCYRITRRGLDAIESSLPVPRFDIRSYRHDVGLAWLWLAAHHGAFGTLAETVSEREMRSRDGAGARAPDPFGVRLGGVGPGGVERLHYPDLLLRGTGGRRVAIELELTSKGRARRERILAGYAADHRIDVVLYLVDRPAAGRALRASAARLGISGRVHVQHVRSDVGVRDRSPVPARAARSEAELAARAARREAELPARAARREAELAARAARRDTELAR
jgi:hypothetical protein